MRKIVSTFLLIFNLTQAFGQTQKKVTTYLLGQYNKTITDATLGNNPSGIGVGLETFFNTKTKFKTTIELTANVYLEDDKVLRTDATRATIDDVRNMITLFVGESYDLAENIYVSVVAVPAFINTTALLGIKPSIGFYFSKNRRWTGKLSYINIFNRNKTTKEDFDSVSFAIGLKLF